MRAGLLLRLQASRRVWLDLSTLEGMAGIGRMLKQVSADRLVFGTAAPFYIPESAILKLKESKLTKEQLDAITFKNAQAL